MKETLPKFAFIIQRNQMMEAIRASSSSAAMEPNEVCIRNSLVFPKNYESLFNNLIGQDVLVFDDFGWWRGMNKCVDSILKLLQVLAAL